MSKFKRGALPTPRHKLCGAMPYRLVAPAPAEFANVPTRLSMWGNDQYGDCVSAEEAFAKIAANPNVFVQEADVIAFARQHGWLNGAYLTEVMDAMQVKGLPSGGTTYQDGPYKSVDWTHRDLLCSAIATGPVKIGVASGQFDNAPGVGNHNGWFMTGFRQDGNTDHCVALTGYGTLGFLFGKLGVPVPTGANPNAFGYLLFTWSTIGVIDEPSMLAVTSEAWLRDPTTAGFPNVPPVPPNPPSPPPLPPSPPVPTPGPILLGSVVIPDQTIQVGLFQHAVVKGGTYPVYSTVSDLTAADVVSMLTAAGITPDTAAPQKLTPQQWQAIIELILQLLPILFPPTPSGMRARAGKLTPQQWAAIIQLILTLLPIFLGG